MSTNEKKIIEFLCLIFMLVFCHICQAEQISEKLGRSEYCGLCHTDIYHQWNASSHHFSSFNNPVYRKVITNNIGVENIETRQFCSKCHDPLLTVDKNYSSNINTWQANSGITCLSCHRIESHSLLNGNYSISEPFLHPFALATDETMHRAHEVILERAPWIHTEVMSKDSYSRSEYCSTCHTLTVPSEINGHHNMPILDEYEAWSQSQYALHKEPDQQTKCQDCHMQLVESDDPAAKNGMIHDHSFAAGNTALAVFNRDFKHLKKAEDFLKNKKITIEYMGKKTNIDEPNSEFFEFKITNSGVGHYFPGGTADSNESWLGVSCQDAEGNRLSLSGLDVEGEIAYGTPRFGVTYVDANDKVTHRGTTTSRAIRKITDTRIAANSSSIVNIKNTLHSINSDFECEAAIYWRKYSPAFINWVMDEETVDIPITKMAHTSFNPYQQ